MWTMFIVGYTFDSLPLKFYDDMSDDDRVRPEKKIPKYIDIGLVFIIYNNSRLIVMNHSRAK